MSYDKTLVVKANSLIEAKYKFSLWEMRVFTRMISLINKDDNQFNLCKIYIKDLIEYFGSTSNNDYDIIKKIPKNLAKKQVDVPYYTEDGEKRWVTLNIFPTVTSPDSKSKYKDGSYIELKFNEDLKPMLLELKKLFNKYDIRNIIPLRSVFSFRIFELLKQYETIGVREMEVEELKEMLGIEDKYSLYANFKRKVILQAQKDLESNCDIKFTFQEKKKNRKVHSIVFFIHSNNPPRLLEDKKKSKTTKKKQQTIEIIPQKPNGVGEEEFEIIFSKIEKWITKATLKKWLKDYPKQQVENGIQYTLNKLNKGNKIPNVGGYLNTMVAQTSLFDSVEEKKQKQAAKAKKSKTQAAKREELEHTKRQLEKERHEKELEIIETILEEMPEARNIALEKVKSGIMARYYDDSKSFEENSENPFFLSAFRGAVKKEFAPQFEEVEKEYEPKIRGVKGAIARL